MTTTGFDTLNLVEPLRRALRAENYEHPTPIQEQAIPMLLEGCDLMGCAQTGSGKTAAFALPILQRLSQNRVRPANKTARALLLAPTRELANQIAESFKVYGRHLGLKQAVVYGGVGKGDQINALSRGVDILIATPGRLLDLEGEDFVRLDKVEIFVLDEADRMLDTGFLPDIRKIIAMIPSKRQSLFFSATLSGEILTLARSMLLQPRHVSITPEVQAAPLIDQRVLFVDREKKTDLLVNLLEDENISRALVFTRTKHRANHLAHQLEKSRIKTDAIHGNKTQAARQKALDDFHSGRIRVLVATDIAARGIDVDDISHVINYELPNEPQNYLHRIGRTARAGKSGTAVSFCDATESGYLHDIERFIRHDVPVMLDHPFHSPFAAMAKPIASGSAGGKESRAGGSSNSRSWKGRRPGGKSYAFRSRRP